MRFGVREFIEHFLNLFSHFSGERGFGFFGADFLSELCVFLAIFAVKSF